MTSILVTGPAVEPITLDEAKAHLRVDSTAEDGLIQSLITAARLHTETLTGRALITQTWRMVLDDWPTNNVLIISLGPLQQVTELRVYEDEDVLVTIQPTEYLVETVGVPARLAMRDHQSWPKPGRPIGGIEIDLTVGYGDLADDVPRSLRQAILQIVAHWYANREAVGIGIGAVHVPATVDALIAPHRAVRL
jgi:uncharacterized phiE125 gp8 family phage protein